MDKYEMRQGSFSKTIRNSRKNQEVRKSRSQDMVFIQIFLILMKPPLILFFNYKILQIHKAQDWKF